jgi:uncharacterized membrane protein YhaH (DUF805 family)
MSITHLLFGFSGRASRFNFWMGQVAIVVMLISIFVIFALAGVTLKTTQSPQAAIGSLGVIMLTTVGLVVVMTWISWAVAIKRLHDRNKSWVWMLTLFIPTFILMWVGLTSGLSTINAFQTSPIFVTVQLGITAWYLIELGFMKGTPGGNMYGPGSAGTGVFSSEFDELLSGEAYDPATRSVSEAGAATAMALAALGPSQTQPARSGAVVRQQGFGRRTYRA